VANQVSSTKLQSLAEIRKWDFDFSADLGSGVTVSSATATHTPPSGVASTPTVGAITGGVVPVTLGPLLVVGSHIVSVVATLNNGEKSEIRLAFHAPF
jgi:hypothetical protein